VATAMLPKWRLWNCTRPPVIRLADPRGWRRHYTVRLTSNGESRCTSLQAECPRETAQH